MNRRTGENNIYTCHVQSDEIGATLNELNPVRIKPHSTVSRGDHGVQSRQLQSTSVARLRQFLKGSRHE
jgi:hypothetical protein